MKIASVTGTIVKIILLLSFLLFFAAIPGYSQKSGLQYEGEIQIEGLISEVTVIRDERGIPHIYAKNEHDLYMASGFISAQERLWQMDIIRRSTTGRLSEIFGKSFVQTDLFMRCLDIEATSKIILKNEDPGIVEVLKAFVDGVNTFITHTQKRLPLEFRLLSYKPDPWRIEDIVNIIGFMGYNLGEMNLMSEIFNYKLVTKLGPEKASKLIPDGKEDDIPIFQKFRLSDTLLRETESVIRSSRRIESLGLGTFSGSNNWAVSGNRSETGKPLLSNDMHLTLGSPGIWMQMHQVIPGKVNVTGVLIPGEPFIIAGHNERIAWGLTNMMLDNIDLFAEKINPEDSGQYFYNGEWKNLEYRKVIINVKGAKNDTTQLKFTNNGPVISGFKNLKDIELSMRWSGSDYSDEIKAMYLLNRAEDWTGFRNSISTFGAVSQNFVYADTEGNIGLSDGGGIPIRKPNGNLVRPGDTDEFGWKGYVPFNQLPFVLNPDEGYVASANNKIVDDTYPYFISTDFCLPFRINRIKQMIGEKEKLGIEDFKKMIIDQHSDLAPLLITYILRINEKAEQLTPLEQQALSLVSKWDYDMRRDLAAPTIFEFFRQSLRKNLLADELGDLYDEMYYRVVEYYIYRVFKNGPDEWVDNINTPLKETLDDIVFLSFRDAVSSISKQYGHNPERWQWGRMHRIEIRHPLSSVKLLDFVFHLNSEIYPIGGNDHTISPYYSLNSVFKIEYGASERHIFNTADWDESYTVIPTGTSGIPGSEFYLSQTRTYIEGGFYRDVFSDEAIKAAAKYTLKLIPQN